MNATGPHGRVLMKYTLVSLPRNHKAANPGRAVTYAHGVARFTDSGHGLVRRLLGGQCEICLR